MHLLIPIATGLNEHNASDTQQCPVRELQSDQNGFMGNFCPLLAVDFPLPAGSKLDTTAELLLAVQ